MTSLILETTQGQCRSSVQALPNKTMGQMLSEFCSKFKLDSSLYALYFKNKEVDLGNQYRFSGIPQNSKLEVRRSNRSSTATEVLIAVQIEDKRLKKKFLNTTTLWEVLVSFENDYNVPIVYRSYEKKKAVPLYLQPKLQYITTIVNTNTNLRSTSLKDLGIQSGTALLRLTFDKTDEGFDDFVEVDKKQALSDTEIREKDKDEIVKKQMEEANQESIQKERWEKMVLEEEKLNDEKRRKMFEEEEELKRQQKIEAEVSKRKKKESRQRETIRLEEDHKDVKEEAIVDPLLARILKEGGSLNRDQEELHHIIRSTARNDLDAIPSEPLDRNPKIYSPSNILPKPTVVEYSDDFFSYTSDDFLTTNKKEDLVLKTSEMRKRERVKKLARYKTCNIRVLMPDQHILEGTFYPQETLQHIRTFIQSQLNDPTLEFYLYIVPPFTLLDDSKNLRDWNLLPAAQIFLGLTHPDRPYSHPLIKMEGVTYHERVYKEQPVFESNIKKEEKTKKKEEKTEKDVPKEKNKESEAKEKEKKLKSLLLKGWKK